MPTLNQTLSAPSRPSENILKIWAPIILFGVLWMDLIRLLSYQWEAREQYAYGWFVPFFVAALLWRRWSDRPSPHFSGFRFSLFALIFLLCLFLLPLRVIYEINTDWPLISWLYTVIVVVITLYAFFLIGGWAWVKHFAFPICFILVAVVWPYRIEKGLTQGLMQVVTTLTVEILGWLNVPALQHGNLIDLSTGTVGVEEACSGIRSFQSSFMAALLMGELYRLRLIPRAILIGCGLALGFCFNIARTLILCWQANAHGLSAIEKWHDPAGMTITVACFFCLWAVAMLMIRWTKSHISPSPGGEGRGEGGPATSIALPNSEPSARNSVRRYLLAVGCWALVSLGATEAWYRSHETKGLGVFQWSVALPETRTGFEKIELPPRSLKLLAFDLGATGKWQEQDGDWTLYFFRWNPSSIQSVIHSRIHRPDVCLPAAGLRQVSESKLDLFDAGNLKLPFRSYIYEAEGRTLYVFFCQWEDGAENQTGLATSKQAGRLQSVLTGRRLLGQQTIELILDGYGSLEKAEAEVRRRLPELIRRDPTPTLQQRVSARAP